MSYLDINGENSGQGLTRKEIAAKIRAYVKKNFPSCKFSVTSPDGSIAVALMEADFFPWCDLTDERILSRIASKEASGYIFSHPSYYIDKGYKQLHESGLDTEIDISEKAREILSDVAKYVKSYNYDHSDRYTDYYDVGFYFDLSIGKWDRPFKQRS